MFGPTKHTRVYPGASSSSQNPSTRSSQRSLPLMLGIRRSLPKVAGQTGERLSDLLNACSKRLHYGISESYDFRVACGVSHQHIDGAKSHKCRIQEHTRAHIHTH
eukprot:scpid107145/ scgid12806/ 